MLVFIIFLGLFISNINSQIAGTALGSNGISDVSASLKGIATSTTKHVAEESVELSSAKTKHKKNCNGIYDNGCVQCTGSALGTTTCIPLVEEGCGHCATENVVGDVVSVVTFGSAQGMSRPACLAHILPYLTKRKIKCLSLGNVAKLALKAAVVLAPALIKSINNIDKNTNTDSGETGGTTTETSDYTYDTSTIDIVEDDTKADANCEDSKNHKQCACEYAGFFYNAKTEECSDTITDETTDSISIASTASIANKNKNAMASSSTRGAGSSKGSKSSKSTSLSTASTSGAGVTSESDIGNMNHDNSTSSIASDSYAKMYNGRNRHRSSKKNNKGKILSKNKNIFAEVHETYKRKSDKGNFI